ncbi:MAG TPA: cytochrome c maturation protein CcmE, partial [Gemmatimonadota bacterium]|nr:cytochrome c maturation protein CcmE [Gemmatimonadota bacterium]
MRRLKAGRLAIAMTLVAGAVAYLVFAATRDNLTYYYEIDELAAATGSPGEKIRLSGDVVAGSIVKEDAARRIRFAIRGTDAPAGSAEVPVIYGGTLPDIFRPDIQVVVEGRLDESGTFHAETLLAKCPS